MSAKRILALLSAVLLPAGAALAQEVVGVTDKEIRIGIMAPLTGNASSFSKAQIGIDAYYKSINDAGGIHGRRIVTVMEDYACDSAKGLAAVRKLIHQDRVFMLHGNSCSAVAMSIKPIVVESNVPWVVAHAANPAISTPIVRHIFHAVPTARAYANAMANFVASKPGIKTVAIVQHTDDWAKSYCTPAAELLAKRGLKPVGEFALERGQTDATAQVLKLRQLNPDFILGCLYEAETVVLLRDMKRYALNAPVMGTGGTDLENTFKRAGDFDTVRNYFVPHPYVDNLDGPKLKPFVDIVRKYYPNETITAFSVASMGSAVMVVEALRRVGRDLTRERFIAELEKMQNFDSQVFAARISYSPTDHDGVEDSAVAGWVGNRATVMRAWGQPF